MKRGEELFSFLVFVGIPAALAISFAVAMS